MLCNCVGYLSARGQVSQWVVDCAIAFLRVAEMQYDSHVKTGGRQVGRGSSIHSGGREQTHVRSI